MRCQVVKVSSCSSKSISSSSSKFRFNKVIFNTSLTTERYEEWNSNQNLKRKNKSNRLDKIDSSIIILHLSKESWQQKKHTGFDT